MPRKKSTGGIFRLLIEHRRYAGWIILVIFGGLFSTGSMVIIGVLMKPMVDALVAGVATDVLKHLPFLLIFSGIDILVTAIHRYAQHRACESVTRDLRRRTARKLVHIPIASLDSVHSGDYVSRFNNDLNQIAGFLRNALPSTIGLIVSGIGGLIVMFVFSWQLTLLSLFAAPVFMVLAGVASKPLVKLSKHRNESLAKVNESAQDAIAGYIEVKTFGLQSVLQDIHDRRVDDTVGKSIGIARVSAITTFIGIFARTVPAILIIAVGAYFVVRGFTTIGTVLTIIQISNVPLQLFAGFASQIITPWQRTRAAVARLYELLDAPEERDGGADFDIEPDQPVISFRDVTFTYAGEGTKEKTTLRNISFDIPAGRTVALVGASGCGKSTIIKLIAGYYEPDTGDILIGGHPAAEWNLTAMRGHMALVEQDTYLFPGSLGENIACPILRDTETPDPERVAAAANAAQIGEYIESLPGRYDEVAGERGVRLSGGQRQRIAMSRAIIRDAEILLLDEPTAALDVETEIRIQDALSGIMKKRTSVVAAHRLSTIRDADTILVIDDGRVVESGTHDELCTLRGRYHQLLQIQTEESDGAA